MLLSNVALQFCRLPCESQVLKRLELTWQGWTTIAEHDLPLPVKMTWCRHFTTTLAGLAREHIPGQVLKVKPHALPPWGLPKWGDQLTLDPSTGKGEVRQAITQDLAAIAKSPQAILIFATDREATQGEGDNAAHWHATPAVLYHQGVRCNTVKDLSAQASSVTS
jgi:hypothetical protein